MLHFVVHSWRVRILLAILVLKHPSAEGLVIFVESKNPAALWLTELSHNAY